MGVIIKIGRKSKPEDTNKALAKLVKKRKKRGRNLSEFYGKLKGVYGDGITYQKKIRDEWP